MKKHDVLVIGDINVDIIVTGMEKLPEPGQEKYVDDIELNVGGGAALCALGLARLGSDVALFGNIGRDHYGRFITEILKKAGVATYLIVKDRKSSTGISIALSSKKDRAFITSVGSNFHVDMKDIPDEAFGEISHIHIAGYKSEINHDRYAAFLKRLEGSGITVSLDIGWDESGEWDKKLFKLVEKVDVFFLNEAEASNYCGTHDMDACLDRISKYCNEVIIKMGSKGALGLKNGEKLYCDTFPVELVDTTGAGDSFNAGYLYGWINKMDFVTCMNYGNACGALSTTMRGGSAAFPDRAVMLSIIDRGVK